jgi:hypothetical protein
MKWFLIWNNYDVVPDRNGWNIMTWFLIGMDSKMTWFLRGKDSNMTWFLIGMGET